MLAMDRCRRVSLFGSGRIDGDAVYDSCVEVLWTCVEIGCEPESWIDTKPQGVLC